MNCKKPWYFAILPVVLLLCLCTVGCNDDAEEAENDSGTVESVTPTGLALGADEVLTWQGDESADGYVVSVNDAEYKTSESYFDLFDILNEATNYEIRVKAIYGGGTTGSGWSIPICYQVEALQNIVFTPTDSSENRGYSINFSSLQPPLPKGKVIIPAVNPADGKPVTAIGQYMFKYCTEMTGVIIPNTVRSIGQGAFLHCKGLLRVSLPEQCRSLGASAFQGNTELKSVRLPSELRTICESAFKDCTALRSISIPETVAEIGMAAFNGCSSLCEVTIPASVETIGNSFSGALFGRCVNLTTVIVAENNPTFRSEGNCIIRRSDGELLTGAWTATIPVGVKSVGCYAFAECTGLTEVVIPDGVERIGYGAFSKCADLTTVVVSGDVEVIDNLAFSGCSALTAVTLSEGLKSLGKTAGGQIPIPCEVFNKCINLASLEIPSTVETISTGLTAGCNSLTSLTVREGNSHYFGAGNCIIRREDSVLVAGCKTSAIPDGVTAIGAYAFYDCASLQRVILPEGVKSIGAGAFAGSGITEIEFPAGLEIIDRFAFMGGSIAELQLPDSVTTIGGMAFSACKQLRVAVIPAGVRAIGYCAFDDCGNLTVILPRDVERIDYAAFSGATVYTSAARDQIPSGWCGKDLFNNQYTTWDDACTVVYDCTFATDETGTYIASLVWKCRDDANGNLVWSNLTEADGVRVPNRRGYTFAGWSTEEGSMTVTFGKTEVTNMNATYEMTLPLDAVRELPTGTVLYAVWTPNA